MPRTEPSFAKTYARPDLGFSAVPRWFRRTPFWRELRAEHRAVIDELFHRIARKPVPRAKQPVDVGVDIQRGQWAISLERLAEASGASVRQVRTAIAHAKAEGIILQESRRAKTARATYAFSLFTWLDFDTYDDMSTRSDTTVDTTLDTTPDITDDMSNTLYKIPSFNTLPKTLSEGGGHAAPGALREVNPCAAQGEATNRDDFSSGPTPCGPLAADQFSPDFANGPTPGQDHHQPGDNEEFTVDPMPGWDELEPGEWEEVAATDGKSGGTSTAHVAAGPVLNVSTSTKAEGRATGKDRPTPATGGRTAEVFKRFTPVQRQQVCSSAAAMEGALLYGVPGLDTVTPAGAAPLTTCWRRYHGTPDNPRSEDWDIPAFAGYYWWIVSRHREKNNVAITIPQWGKLAGVLKSVLATLPSGKDLHRMIQMLASHFTLIKWMAGPKIGPTLQLGETSLVDTMTRKGLDTIMASTPEQLDELYNRLQPQ